VHLQRSITAIETVEANKYSFEHYAASHGVYIHHFHADNGRFADNLFRQAVVRKGQTLSFYGDNAHFQNGVAERRIRELQDHARCMLIHAHRRWPEAITSNLWPYTLRMANSIHNKTPSLKFRQSPSEKFTGTQDLQEPKYFQTLSTGTHLEHQHMSWTAMLHLERSSQSGLTEQGLESTWGHCPNMPGQLRWYYL